ncbi:MAG: AAA family ATPase, partial [Bdellovibrionales bacterium]|nr:AAA family ATPase [Bdellovibrionales bacterium]
GSTSRLEQGSHRDATAVLTHIRTAAPASLFALMDFHPYLEHPMRVRLLKEIALAHESLPHTVILVSPALTIPPEIQQFAVSFHLSLPNRSELETLVGGVAEEWMQVKGSSVTTNTASFDLLVRNLSGLPLSDARRLARTAVFDDGAITQEDAQSVMQAKYQLLNRDGVLAFEYDTATFADIAGLERLKSWLDKRKAVFLPSGSEAPKLDAPKGVLLLGVQGCGKSLAAKAVAGAWGVPLLRLDFGAIYQKYIGETEKNLRESLESARVMAPCVLWLDEIEKGLSTGDVDGGTSRRILGMLLTWMAEKKEPVFIVATANDIEQLPPELIRKGRFDEIFFVDLPSDDVRKTIFRVHIKKRELDPETFDLAALAAASASFSGAEIEQAVVAARYSAAASSEALTTEHILAELRQTKPLAVVMAEKVDYLRSWARDRTIPADEPGTTG